LGLRHLSSTAEKLRLWAEAGAIEGFPNASISGDYRSSSCSNPAKALSEVAAVAIAQPNGQRMGGGDELG
jgi:hypothetical protein